MCAGTCREIFIEEKWYSADVVRVYSDCYEVYK